MYATIIWRFISILSSFCILVVLKNTTTIEIFGEIQFILSLISITLIFSMLGNGSLSTRYASCNDNENLQILYIIQLICSIITVIFFCYILFNLHLINLITFPNFEYLVSIVILYSFMQLTAGTFRGKKIFHISQGIEGFFKLILPLFFLLVAYLFNIKITTENYFFIIFMCAFVSILVFSFDILPKIKYGILQFYKNYYRTRDKFIVIIKETIAITATISVANSMRFIDIAMLGLISNFNAVAEYKVCVSIALLASVMFSAIGQFVIPHLGKDISTNMILVRRVTLLAFACTILSCLALYLLSPFILITFFSLNFEAVKHLLLMLLLPNIFVSFLGYTYEFCVMNNLGTKLFLPAILVVILNIFTNFILISAYGAFGAALSTAVCSVLFAYFTWYVIKKKYGIRLSIV